MVNTKENTLAAIRYQEPEFVPVFDGTVWDAVQLEGNFKNENWTDHWGVRWQTELDGLYPVDTYHPLSDIKKIDDFQWPDPWKLTWTQQEQDHLEAIDRDAIVVGGVHVRFLCERLCCLMGMDNFMVAMYEDPERVQILIDRITDYNLVVFQRLIELDVDILHVSEDLGTQQALMMSPEMFRKFLLPAYEKMFSMPRSRGVLIDFHSCGCIQEIVSDLISAGVSILNPLQAKANDQREIKSVVNGKMAILGGIDSTIVLNGTPKDVRSEIRRAFEILKPGGGWLAGPDQVIVGAPKNNVEALWETCWKLSKY